MVRFKNRYLLCEVRYGDERCDSGYTHKDFYDLVRDSIALNFGDLGSGRLSVSLGIKYWNAITGLAVLRIAREDLRTLWAAVSLISYIKARKARVQVLHCAGTIRKCEERAKRYLEDWMREAKQPLEKRRRAVLAADAVSELQAMQP